ncbi:MAG: hypothetical protein FJ006_11710 [Chloroflexi bacterium]|nr:hypothetical protein [Chloroflexota bacterium]
MKRFKIDVKLFVLDERAEGKGWKRIKERIRQKFNIEPPTIRAMQKWEKKLDRAALSAEFVKDVKREMPAMGAEAQVSFAQELLPILWKARDAGEDMELAGWKWFLHFIDTRLGSNGFERLITEYMSERQK